MRPLVPTFSINLMLASLAISILAAYVAFSLADRMRHAESRRTHALWLAGGSVAMGAGIWSMHYLGMLAVVLPIEVRYYVPTVLVSLLLAIGAAAIALLVVSAPTLSKTRLLGGGLLMGAGIGSMHYTGMAAMRMSAMHHYNPVVVLLSVVDAVLLSFFALRIGFSVRAEKYGEWSRALAGTVMGLAIASMHYIAMAGIRYTADNMPYSTANTVYVSSLGKIGIAGVVAILLIAALVSALLNRRRYSELHHAQQELLLQRTEMMEVQRQLTEANRLLNDLSTHDALTGLHNRRYFDSMLHLEWQRAERSGEYLALLLIDVDCFKGINDSLGHIRGDECLRLIAELLTGAAQRSSDVVARYGGEEFAVLLPEVAPRNALIVAERMRLAMEQRSVYHPSSTVASVLTLSIGVSSRVPDAAATIRDLVRDADDALYLAKRNGRNRSELAESESKQAEKVRG